MKSMKRLAALLCAAAFALPGGALAQEYYTLPEIREQAAQGWHETYTDKYGREIAVDVDVQVFGEDVAPVLKVGLPDYVKYTSVENNPYESVMNVRRSGGQRTRYCVKYGEKVEPGKAYGADIGNDLTLREAYDYLREHLTAQGIPAEDFLYDQPRDFEMLCNTSQATGEVLSQPFYNLDLWPTLRGMPILAHVMDGAKKAGWPWYRAELFYMVRERGAHSIVVHTLVERETLAEDIPLCPLERVIENVEREIEAGRIQKVYALRFGYSLYNDPAIQSSTPVSVYDIDCPFYAVPSWVIECIFAENPSETVLDGMDEGIDERAYAKTITINAQTGDMLDPLDESKFGLADGDYKGFIPWDDVK